MSESDPFLALARNRSIFPGGVPSDREKSIGLGLPPPNQPDKRQIATYHSMGVARLLQPGRKNPANVSDVFHNLEPDDE